MNRTRRLGLLAILTAAMTGGIYTKWGTTSTRGTTAVAQAEGARVRWPVGSELRYRLSWHTSTGVHMLPGGGVQGRIDSGGASTLEGTLVLKVARASDGKATLLASFADLDTAQFVVRGEGDGKVVPEDTSRAALLGHVAALDVDDRGHLVEMRAPKDAGPMFGDVMHALATELSFELAKGDDPSWTSEERTMTGLAQSSYRVEKSDDGTCIERRRDGYKKIHALRSLEKHAPAVTGTTRIQLAKDGPLSSFESSEEVHIEDHGQTIFESKTSLTLTVASRVPFAFAGDDELASFEVHVQGRAGDPHAADRALAGKLSRQDLLAFVAGYAASGSFERGQLARAAAYLRLHPEECKTLEETFGRQDTANGKSIVFDVLTSAGSPEAQASLLRLLGTASATKDASLHRMLVQRLALVASPTKESIAYLEDLERTAKRSGDARLANAALVARGAAIGHRMARGDAEAKEEARALLARARGDLSGTSADDRATLIKAIGNLHHPDASEALAPHAKDANAEVRASVATALRKTKDERAARVLFDLMGDEDAYVARSAIDSHLGRRLDAKELDAFASHVRANGTSAESDMTLAGAILRHAETNKTAVRSVLETLLQRAQKDSEEAMRLRAALEELPA